MGPDWEAGKPGLDFPEALNFQLSVGTLSPVGIDTTTLASTFKLGAKLIAQFSPYHALTLNVLHASFPSARDGGRARHLTSVSSGVRIYSHVPGTDPFMEAGIGFYRHHGFVDSRTVSDLGFHMGVGFRKQLGPWAIDVSGRLEWFGDGYAFAVLSSGLSLAVK